MMLTEWGKKKKEDSGPVITGRSYSNMKGHKMVKPHASHRIHANLKSNLRRAEVLELLTSV